MVWKSRDLFRVISMRNRLISDFRAVFNQKFIYLTHVTSWWCPISKIRTNFAVNKFLYSNSKIRTDSAVRGSLMYYKLTNFDVENRVTLGRHLWFWISLLNLVINIRVYFESEFNFQFSAIKIFWIRPRKFFKTHFSLKCVGKNKILTSNSKSA